MTSSGDFPLCQLLFFGSKRWLLVGFADRYGHLPTLSWLINAVCLGCWWELQGAEKSWDFLCWRAKCCCCYPKWILYILENHDKRHWQISERYHSWERVYLWAVLAIAAIQSNSCAHIKWFLTVKKIMMHVPLCQDLHLFLQLHSFGCWTYWYLCAFFSISLNATGASLLTRKVLKCGCYYRAVHGVQPAWLR